MKYRRKAAKARRAKHRTNQTRQSNHDTKHLIVHADNLHWLSKRSKHSVDFIFTSPPYEDKRLYDELDFSLTGDRWVTWCYNRFIQCCRVSRGLTAWVVRGKTVNGRYSFTPEKLALKLFNTMDEIDNPEIVVPEPAIFQRYGLPGGGHWFRSLTEKIICAAHRDNWPLPYENFKVGPPPKYKRGGDFSNRQRNGKRIGKGRSYPQVDRTWKTNVFEGKVGKGHMGSDIAHENEAPFPEWLVEQWLEVFTQPGDVVLDPFAGSGTVGAVCQKMDRRSILIDIRESQIDLCYNRLLESGAKEQNIKTVGKFEN